MNTFNSVPYYQVNREERHFGFLFMAALVCGSNVRARLIEYINAKAASNLNAKRIDVYAEVSLFRDYWNKLGDATVYTDETHACRREIVCQMLNVMELPTSLIDQEPVFWTGEPGQSKLFYPGKWHIDKIKQAQEKHRMEGRQLLRLRWACNAKPDVLIEDDNEMVFVEIKVESGFGRSENGYDQAETQLDIMKLAKALLPTASRKRIGLTSLTREGDGLRWDEVFNIVKANSVNEYDSEMMLRHLNHIPKKTELSNTDSL